MQFLDRLHTADRERLLAAARPLSLAKGAYLMRRGDPGGDLYLLEQGELEIVDTRSRPEVVLDSVGPGGVVGEMAFLDAAPRAADVRAAADSQCMRWERGALQATMEADPRLAAAFFHVLAELMVDRVRAVTSSAVAGGLGASRAAPSGTTVLLARDSYDAAERARQRWMDAEGRLRRDPGAANANDIAREAAAALVSDMVALVGRFQDSGRLQQAGQALSRELHAFLVRSRTVVLAWEAAGKGGARPDVVGHLVRGLPSGEGTMGQELDAALLALPTPVALRWRAAAAGALAAAASEAAVRRGAGRPDAPGAGRPLRALIVNGAATGLPEQYGANMVSYRGGAVRLTVVEESRELLLRIGSGRGGLPLNVELRRVQDDLGGLVSGRSRLHHEPQDVIVLDGLVEYLPERVLAGLMAWARDHLAPGGTAIFTGLGPSSDAAVWAGLLGWPQIRRSASSLAGLLAEVGLGGVRAEAEGAGVVAAGGRRVNA